LSSAVRSKALPARAFCSSARFVTRAFHVPRPARPDRLDCLTVRVPWVAHPRTKAADSGRGARPRAPERDEDRPGSGQIGVGPGEGTRVGNGHAAGGVAVPRVPIITDDLAVRVRGETGVEVESDFAGEVTGCRTTGCLAWSSRSIQHWRPGGNSRRSLALPSLGGRARHERVYLFLVLLPKDEQLLPAFTDEFYGVVGRRRGSPVRPNNQRQNGGTIGTRASRQFLITSDLNRLTLSRKVAGRCSFNGE
jgi:hypothetical protein